jgi:DNA-binding transcriptional ArsR family regulator
MKNLWLFDRRRLEILELLSHCPAGGCDLKKKLKLYGPLLSYHLAKLKKEGYVQEEKCGRAKTYRLSPAKQDFVLSVLNVVK